MSEQALSTTSRSFTRKPNSLPTDDKRRRGNGGLTKRVRIAIEAQAFDGLRRAEAAAKAGIAEHTLYQALRKPSVLAFWNECLQVLRTGERARNIHRLTEIREQDENRTAAVQAIKVLEEATESRSNSGSARAVTPGVVINITTREQTAVDATVIEINPLETQEESGAADE